MSRIRGLELLFNLEKNHFKSAADCAVAAFHCLLINEGLQCVGTGDVWSDSNSESSTSEMLPTNWNDDQEVYSLRYVSKDRTCRVLLKIAKADHMLLVNAVKNENTVATMSFPVVNYVSSNYEEYSTAYKDLESLGESFRKEIMEVLTTTPKPAEKQSEKKETPVQSQSTPPSQPPMGVFPQQPSATYQPPYPYPFPPRVGGSDLDPFGRMGGGGMLMDPSGFGIPPRPSLPQFGVGGPGGLPRGAVPPGARFDPFMPPIRPNRNPDHFKPPDYDEFM